MDINTTIFYFMIIQYAVHIERKLNRKCTISAFNCVLTVLQITSFNVNQDFVITPTMWDELFPCCCMWKMRPRSDDCSSFVIISQNLIVTLPGTNRGSLNWVVMLIGAVMTPTPLGTFVLFYFSQADRQHPDTWCSLQSVSKQPGWQIEELIVREGPDTLQAGTPGNSDLNLLHIFWHRLIYLALIFFLG